MAEAQNTAAAAAISCSTTTAKKASEPTKRLFAECALVEIIHLHDCLRGALHLIQKDVDSLVHTSSFIQDGENDESEKFDMQVASELSNNVASRFHLIWSVFQAHSGAEDEFIWPALKMKIESKKGTSSTSSSTSVASGSGSGSGDPNNSSSTPNGKKCGCESFLEQEAYEEDHEKEETMFKQINTTLRRLNGSFRYYHSNPHPAALSIIKKVILLLKEQTDNLHQHLEQHLEKEETQCLPVVKKHLSNEEISTLVGQIMGKRSAEMMGKILNLAVCSLPGDEREDMVLCLKKAMGGTFFEKWLTMGGWDCSSVVGESSRSSNTDTKARDGDGDATDEDASTKRKHGAMDDDSIKPTKKIAPFQGHITDSRLRYPSRYYVKKGSKTILTWNSIEARAGGEQPSENVPQFAQSELTPTYHFSESQGNMVLGCQHYSRACKLRHPDTGQLFTCRLCCDEVCHANTYTYESLPVLDRHSVSEIICMRCGSLQPAGSKCVNSECESGGKAFAKYFCSICNLYDDDESKQIYHCPYCNVCRKGEGLGIDFRHCMRCNACVVISEYDTHVCISQKLQGNCPICNESLFESIEPFRGMECGHTMHLSCYNQYASRCAFGTITCPLCKRIFDHRRG